MIQVKRLLFPTDFSRCAEQAFLHALFLAEQYSAQLQMLHVNLLHSYDPSNPDYKFPRVDQEMQDQLEATIAEHMKTKIAKHRAGDIEVKEVKERGFAAAPVILEYAADNDIDLIVMGTHGHRGLGHFLLGSVAEEIIRLARCPVLTVRERKETSVRTDISHILVPVDFSEHSQKALTYAKEVALTYDARLQVLHVIETPVFPSFYGTTGATILDMSASIASQAKAELDSFLSSAKGPEVPVDLHVIEGHSGTDIVKFADSHSTDLIVIATHGLSEIEELLVGSTTEKVVRRASCPVLTVNVIGKSLLVS